MLQTCCEQTALAQSAVSVATMLLVLLVAQKEVAAVGKEREEHVQEEAAVDKEEEGKVRMAGEEVEQEDQVDNQQALKRTRSWRFGSSGACF